MPGGVLLANFRRASIRHMGRKLFFGLLAPLAVLALAVPANADLDAQDQQFLTELKAAGWTINSAQGLIGQAHMVCGEGFAHGVTWQEMRTTLMSSYGFSNTDATTLISKAVSVYCPKYRDALGDTGSDSNSPATRDQDDQFVESLKRNQGITIDKAAAVDMAKTACKAPIAGVGAWNAVQVLQQRYPKYDLDTVAKVTAWGLLAYCPERLP